MPMKFCVREEKPDNIDTSYRRMCRPTLSVQINHMLWHYLNERKNNPNEFKVIIKRKQRFRANFPHFNNRKSIFKQNVIAN